MILNSQTNWKSFWYSSLSWKFNITVKNPPLSKQSPFFSPTPPFLEKIFHPHLYCKIWGNIFVLYTPQFTTTLPRQFFSMWYIISIIFFLVLIDMTISIYVYFGISNMNIHVYMYIYIYYFCLEKWGVATSIYCFNSMVYFYSCNVV